MKIIVADDLAFMSKMEDELRIRIMYWQIALEIKTNYWKRYGKSVAMKEHRVRWILLVYVEGG